MSAVEWSFRGPGSGATLGKMGCESGDGCDQAIRILLVDDVADLRLLLRIVLRNRPEFDVVGEAGGGEEAVEMATQLQPDLILLDIAMPYVDGLTALPRLRDAV